VTAAQHCDERHGMWCAEGFYDFLLSGHADALWLLDRVKFLLLFCVNPQGIYAGNVRSTPQYNTVDLNREWGANHPQEVYRIVEDAIAAECPNRRALIDWHNLGNVHPTANPAGSHLQFGDSPQIRAFIERINVYHPVTLFTG
jgi:hypothetical protein